MKREIKKRGKRPAKIMKTSSGRKNAVRKTDGAPKADAAKKSFRGFKVIEGGKSPKNMMKKTVAAVAAVVLVIVLIYINSLAPGGIPEWIKTQFAGGSGDGYPVTYSDSTSKNIYSSGGRTVVLTSTDLKCYNGGGKEIYSRLHGYANPVVKTTSIRTLTFDRAGSQYRIDSPSSTIYNGKTDGAIIAADISESGVYAVAAESTEDVAKVTVYNKNNSEIYRYFSSSNYVSAVSVSDDGKKLCVVVISTDQAKVSSKLLIFSLSKTDPIAEREFSDEMIYSAEFVNDKNVVVLSEKRWASVDTSGNCKEYSFDSKRLIKYEISGDKTLLCLAADAKSADNTIVALDSAARVKAEFDVNTSVNSLSMSGSKIYVLSGELYSYSYNGEQTGHESVLSGAIAVKSCSRGAAVLYSNGVTVYR